MSHCVAGVPPVVACGVVPLGVVNSTTGFPGLLPLLLKDAAGIDSSEVRVIRVAPYFGISCFFRPGFTVGTPC
jgi:hypothetical protein